MKKLLLGFLAFTMTLGILNYGTSIGVSAEEKINSETECLAVGDDIANNEGSTFIESKLLDNLDIDRLIHQTAQAVDNLMSSVFVTDMDGNLISVDVDVLELEYGVSAESIELKRILNQRNTTLRSDVMSLGLGYHYGRFASCFIKQIARSFGVSSAIFVGKGELINLVGKKSYYRAVQKMAQIAVNKLGKKAALKLVEFATPAGWSLSAGKVALWTYRCTVEYEQWA